MVGQAFSGTQTFNMVSLGSYMEDVSAAYLKTGGAKYQKLATQPENVSKLAAAQPESS
jgi:hypothetical protein